MQASGRSGLLYVGYQKAAVLGAWKLETDPMWVRKGSRLRAVIAAEDAYWITQPPFDVVLELGDVRWRWSGIRPQMTGSELIVTLTSRPAVEKAGT